MSAPWFDELEWVVASNVTSNSQSYLALGSLAVTFIEDNTNNKSKQDSAIKTALEFEEGAEILKSIGYDDSESQTIVLSHFQREYPVAYHIAFEEIQAHELKLSVDVDKTVIQSFNPETIRFQCQKGYSLNRIAKVVFESLPQLFGDSLEGHDLTWHRVTFQLTKEIGVRARHSSHKTLHVSVSVN